MAKKKLILNESTTRMFMKYANIEPTYVSNFLTEAEDFEEDEEEGMEGEEGMEMDADLGGEEEEEVEMDAEEPDASNPDGLVMALLTKVQEFAKENGVKTELEGDEGEDIEDDGLGEPEGGDMGMPDDSEVDDDLEAADVDMEEEPMDDEEVIAEVTRRVARRLLRESAKRQR